MRPELVCCALVLSFTACATKPATRIDGRTTTTVELTIKELDEDMSTSVEKELKAIENVKSVQLKGYQLGVATYLIEYSGDPTAFEEALARIKHPTLKNGVVLHRVEVTAVDTQPPRLDWIHPRDGQVVATAEQNVLLEVPDRDLKEILVNGHVATRFKGSNIYKAKVTFRPGPQEVLVVISDRRDNLTRKTFQLTVDDTPHTLKENEKSKIEGQVAPGSTVIVEGAEFVVDVRGFYRGEIPVRAGQKSIEVIVISEDGKRDTKTQAL